VELLSVVPREDANIVGLVRNGDRVKRCEAQEDALELRPMRFVSRHAPDLAVDQAVPQVPPRAMVKVSSQTSEALRWLRRYHSGEEAKELRPTDVRKYMRKIRYDSDIAYALYMKLTQLLIVWGKHIKNSKRDGPHSTCYIDYTSTRRSSLQSSFPAGFSTGNAIPLSRRI
jgi:hypothetical protein